MISFHTRKAGHVLFLLFLLWAHALTAQTYRIVLSSDKAGKPGNRVLENTFEVSRYFFSFESLDVTAIKTEKGTFSELTFSKGHYVGETGTPKLPALHKLIEIPYGAEATVMISQSSVQEFLLSDYDIFHPVMPVQPSMRKTQDAAEVPFSYTPEAYAKSGYVEPDVASLEILGSLRGTRLARLTVAPVSYNPSEGVIKVYNDIEVAVEYSGADPDKMAYIKASTHSPYFDILKTQLFSSFAGNESQKSSFSLPGNPVRMLVISTPDFQETLQPYIRWQTERGFQVIERYTNLIGSSSSAIRNFISGEYHSSTPEKPAPTFLVIAGDIDRIPASSMGFATGEITDLYYAAVDGDFFPDMYYGRLSARNTQELKNQLDKIIYYQQYQFEDPSYLNDVTLIAGNDPFWNQLVLQPTVKYGEQNYFLPDNGFVNVNMFLSNYTGVYDNENISVGLINYTAHCIPISWYNPWLTTTDIQQFSNIGKYPLVVGNCCRSALFNGQESIGEAWVRAENKGAVAYIGSAPDTYIFEDFYWSVGAFPLKGNNGGYVPGVAETTTGVYDAPFKTDYLPIGAIKFFGNLAVTQAHIRGFQSHSNTHWYWEAYHTLGDPSTMLLLTEAEENDIAHYPVLPIGESHFRVKALPGSYVALSNNGTLVGAGFVDEGGIIDIPVHQVTAEENIKIVVTKYQHKPYIREIPALVPNGPFVVYHHYSINDAQGNNNQRADYGETISLNIGLKNIGVEPVDEVHAWLSTDDEYVILESPEVPVVFSGMQIASDKNVSSVEDAFRLTMCNNVPNMHRVRFILRVSDGNHEWHSEFFIRAYAPILWIDPVYIVNDATHGNNNGRLDPGETISLGFRVYNKGGAQARRPSVHLHASSPFFSYNPDSINLGYLNPGAFRVASFQAHANPATQNGVMLPLNVSVNDGHHDRAETNITIGQATTATIGKNKIASNQFPFYNLYKSNRTQMIYLASELGAGEKTIRQIGMEIIEAATQQTVMRNLTIKIQHTDISQFSNAFQNLSNAQTVFYSAAYQMPVTTGWHFWDINDFSYDGQRNLLIEITWGQNAGWTTTFYRVASTEFNRNRTVYGISDNHTVAPFSGVSPVRPNLFLKFDTPPPKPLYSAFFMTINNTGQPVDMSEIKIGSRTQYTNLSGITTFSLYPGEYKYRIIINNKLRSTVESNLVVENIDRTIVYTLYDALFNPKNNKSGEAIPDAIVSVNGTYFDPGAYLMKYLPPGEFSYTIARDGYHELSGTFMIDNQNLEIDLMMIPDTTVSSPALSAQQADKPRVFPNPAREQINITFPLSDSHTYIELVNHQGQVIIGFTTDVDAPGKTIGLNVSALPAGLYFIRVRQGTTLATEKLIIY